MTVYATEYIRDADEGEMMAQLFRCSDGKIYVVKVMLNPTGKRALFNELVAYRLGALLSLPVAYGQVIVFSKNRFSDPNLFDQMGIQEGPHFGSLFMEGATSYSSDKLPYCKNIYKLPDLIVFDNWISNFDRKREPQNLLIVGKKTYEFVLIDHAHAFNGPNWTIESLISWTYDTDSIWGGIYQDFIPYMDNKEPFGRALTKLNALTDREMAAAFGKDLPPEWEVSKEEVQILLFHLIKRKEMMKELITSLKGYFPIWNASS